jgi:hypothetical protein
MYQNGELDESVVDLDLDALSDISSAAAAGPAGVGGLRGPDASSSSSSSSAAGPGSAGHAALGSLASTIMEAMSRHGAVGPGGMRGRGKRRMKVSGGGVATSGRLLVGLGYQNRLFLQSVAWAQVVSRGVSCRSKQAAKEVVVSAVTWLDLVYGDTWCGWCARGQMPKQQQAGTPCEAGCLCTRGRGRRCGGGEVDRGGTGDADAFAM